MIKAFIGSAAVLALVGGAAAPAAARPYWGGGGGYYHHHRGGGGDTVGKLLLGAIIGGGAVAIANSSKQNRSEPSRRADDQRDDLRVAGDDAREVSSMCTQAVENMARGPVSSIDSVGREGRDGWRVDGVVRGERGDRQFLCAVRDGLVEQVQLNQRYAAR